MIPRFPALTDIDVDSLFSFNPSFNTRGHVCKLYKTRCAKATRRNFFACKMVNVWNSLPDTVCFSSLTGFSQSLKDNDLSVHTYIFAAFLIASIALYVYLPVCEFWATAIG